MSKWRIFDDDLVRRVDLPSFDSLKDCVFYLSSRYWSCDMTFYLIRAPVSRWCYRLELQSHGLSLSRSVFHLVDRMS